ncbi:Ferredoxin--nitrite reductase [Planctomycetales bacterium 10988]|nr:Ferredoxin--nitrite reductase [Planctomycetales bacterium 10988]
MSEESKGMSTEQKNYLQGFVMGSDVARAVRGLPVLSGSGNPNDALVQVGGSSAPAFSGPKPAEAIHYEVQDQVIASGKKLSKEEQAKREKNPLDMWDQMVQAAKDKKFPSGTDVFLYKFRGLFYVTPAQNAFMCRLRIPGGHLSSWQFRGIADLADQHAGGYIDATTRANLQLREIGPEGGPPVLLGLQELGLIIQGSGGDNIRNVTASPLSGIDPTEVIETLPLAKEMHHYILQHREMYGLPRKFNIAFDGGGTISALEDTNDIGFHAVRISAENASEDLPEGVYFQLALGGITGHKDFARYTGVLLKPEECVAVASAIVQVFIAHGDRTDRKKARLKYVLDDWGFDKFLDEVEKVMDAPLRRVPMEKCEPNQADDRTAHLGFHPQSQPGKHYVGVVLPVGRMTSDQVRALSDIADRFGTGIIRLTVWQNLLIPNIDEEAIPAVQEAIRACGLDYEATNIRGGLIACTGNTGCKFSSANTKGQAMILAGYLEERFTLEHPINIHLTGCPNSCAQHYIGDLGLQATKVEVEEDMVEGYHVCVGGGWGENRAIGRELYPSVPFEEVPPLVERILHVYLQERADDSETFSSFTRRHEVEELRSKVEAVAVVPS